MINIDFEVKPKPPGELTEGDHVNLLQTNEKLDPDERERVEQDIQALANQMGGPDNITLVWFEEKQDGVYALSLQGAGDYAKTLSDAIVGDFGLKDVFKKPPEKTPAK